MLVAVSRDEGGNADFWGIRPSKERKFRERIYKGIPDCWRSAAWEILMCRFSRTGKGELRQLMRDYRDALDKPSSYDVQIDLDVPRTISGHVMFKTRYGQGCVSLSFHYVCYLTRMLVGNVLSSMSCTHYRFGARHAVIVKAWALLLLPCSATMSPSARTPASSAYTTRTTCTRFSVQGFQDYWKLSMSRSG